MDWNGFLREKKWKHVKKDQWLILFLAGVLLLIIAMPAGRKNSATSDVEMNTQNSQSAVTAQGGSDYETYGAALEQRLETILQRMRGVGDVQVMITLASSEERVTLQNDSATTESTGEDGTGSKRQKESATTESVLVRKDGQDTPYLVQILTPEIEGVVVVASGADSGQTDTEIIAAVQALFPVQAHKIRVMKMK